MPLLALILLLVQLAFGAKETKLIRVEKTELMVEIPTAEKFMSGLMHRTSLPQNSGMLFLFPNEKPLNFWMKNTKLPLSIGFFDKKFRLVDIQDMHPLTEKDRPPPLYTSKKPAKFALEVNKGWFKENNIKIGDTFEFAPDSDPLNSKNSRGSERD